MDITELLVFTKKNNASDLHISTGNPPILRIHGDMVPMKMEALQGDEIKTLLYSIMTEEQRTNYERDYEIDFAISLGRDMRYRVNAFTTLNGPAAAFRTIPTEILTLEQLGAPAILKDLAELPKGLILVTGPTGSGKSTTLAAMVDHLNSNYAMHILTIEDPIEFIHPSKKSLVNQREVGGSTQSFARALKSSLREDPDVILVGELRDLETIQLAMTAAETGHLVMGTLHTNSAPKTIDRIIDVFPAQDKEMIRAMLSVSIQGIVTQALLKKADNTGRVAVHEILLGTPAVRNLIRENKIPQITSMMQTGAKIGMRTMKDSVYALLEQGIVTREEAKRVLASGGSEKDEDIPAGGGSNLRTASGYGSPRGSDGF
jgi:twitching motility protein PilT